MPGSMEVDVTKWSHSQLNGYIDNSMDGFTESQKLHMANRILNQYEDKKRMTELQGDNMETADDKDYPYEQ